MSELSQQDVERIAAAVAQKMGGGSEADIAAAAAHKVVQEMTVKGLDFVGVDLADKKQIEALKADLSFVRSFRERCERVGNSMTTAISQAIIWGVIGLLVIGFMLWMRDGSVPHMQNPPHLTK